MVTTWNQEVTAGVHGEGASRLVWTKVVQSVFVQGSTKDTAM